MLIYYSFKVATIQISLRCCNMFYNHILRYGLYITSSISLSFLIGYYDEGTNHKYDSILQYIKGYGMRDQGIWIMSGLFLISMMIIHLILERIKRLKDYSVFRMIGPILLFPIMLIPVLMVFLGIGWVILKFLGRV